MGSPAPRNTPGVTTALPITHSELVDLDYLNATALVVARKVTAKDVSNTVTETDLLNGEVTLPANVLGTTGLARLTMWGDGAWDVGQVVPQFKAKLGSGPTMLLDTGVAPRNTISASVTRGSWRMCLELLNLGGAGSQLAHLSGIVYTPGAVGATEQHSFATGQGQVWSGELLGASSQNWQPAPAFYEGINPSCSIDTTADQLIQFTVINGSGTSTDIKLLGAILEVV